MKRLLLLALAGCYTSSPSAHPIGNQVHVADEWVLGEGGVGPVTADTESTKDALQRLLPSLRVQQVDLGDGSGIVYEVHDPHEKLFYVVPDDAERDEGDEGDEGMPRRYATTIFAIFATSSKVAVDGKAWRVGSQLREASDVSVCECWGGGEVTACWTNTAHIHLIFEERCENAAKMGGKAMIGKRIGRIMWKREPEAPPSPDATPRR